jgi:hypothetical protein
MPLLVRQRSVDDEHISVKSGKYRPGDETREGLPPPDEVHESFASFVEAFLKDRS